jgi:hypothetical protein
VDATLRLNKIQTEVAMETQTNGRRRFGGARDAIGGVRTKVSEAVAHVPEAVSYARREAGRVADRLPSTLGHVRAGAEGTVTNLQTMPDSGLRLLAAVSVGFGAGLRLAGKTRLATLAGFAPASIFGFAIFSRPRPARPEPRPVRP